MDVKFYMKVENGALAGQVMPADVFENLPDDATIKQGFLPVRIVRSQVSPTRQYDVRHEVLDDCVLEIWDVPA